MNLDAGTITLLLVAFFAQIAEGAEAGAWATGTSAVIMFFIVGLALTNADKQIRPFDWVALSGAIVGMLLWRLTKERNKFLYTSLCANVARMLRESQFCVILPYRYV